MIKNINRLLVIFAFASFASCGGGGDDSPAALAPVPNTAPTSVATLVYPNSDILCIDSTIEFEWSAATDSDGDVVSYRLTIALNRELTNIVEQLNVTTTSRVVNLEPGTAYYWNVVAKDSQDDAEPSETYAFYTEGNGVSNYAPFTASLNGPLLEAFLDSGLTSLDWTGGDVDMDDTLTYDVYFGETNVPDLLQSGLTASTLDVTTIAATTYYWKVDTTDDNNVKSIGQVWSFSTN